MKIRFAELKPENGIIRTIVFVRLMDKRYVHKSYRRRKLKDIKHYDDVKKLTIEKVVRTARKFDCELDNSEVEIPKSIIDMVSTQWVEEH